jgi:hypothetical protein
MGFCTNSYRRIRSEAGLLAIGKESLRVGVFAGWSGSPAGGFRGINIEVVWIVPDARPLPAWRMRPDAGVGARGMTLRLASPALNLPLPPL